MLIVRAAKAADIDAMSELAEEAGTGFTSLSVSRDVLAERLEKSEAAYLSDPEGQTEDTYQLMLEDTETGKIIDTVLAEEGRPPESIFDFVQGITAVARDKPHQDVRLDMEAKAKKLFDRAA